MEEFINTDEIFRELQDLEVTLRRDSSTSSIYSSASQKKEWEDYWAWLVFYFFIGFKF